MNCVTLVTQFIIFLSNYRIAFMLLHKKFIPNLPIAYLFVNNRVIIIYCVELILHLYMVFENLIVASYAFFYQ